MTELHFDKEKYKYDSILSMMNKVTERAAVLEQQIINQALTEYLKREPTEEDSEKTKRAFRELTDPEYSLLYDGVEIGVIKRSFENKKDGVLFKIEFYPHGQRS